MSSMFYGCSNLNFLKLSTFNTSNVINMNSMFSGCSNLTLLNLSKFNTNKVQYMDSMCSGCSNLNSLNLSTFNTSNVINMSSMFSGCSNLNSLNLSTFYTPSLKNKRQKVMIGTGSMADPYMPIEKRLEYTRSALKLIYKYGQDYLNYYSQKTLNSYF